MFPNLTFGAPVPTAATAPTTNFMTLAGYGQSLTPPLPGPAVPAVPAVPGLSGAPGAPMGPMGLAPYSGVMGLEGAIPGQGPAMPGGGGWLGGMRDTFLNENGSWNLPAMGDLAKGIGAFGSLYLGMKANAQAADALAFQKRAYKTNLANSIDSYNLALEDRIRARGAQQGDSEAETDAYIRKHKLGR